MFHPLAPNLSELSNEDLFQKYSGEKFRENMRQWLNVWAERQEVVDQLIDTALNPKQGIPVILGAMAKAKFDMNPSKPAGHRAFGLSVLARSNDDVGKDPRVSKALAQSAAKPSEAAAGGKVHCGLSPEVDNLMKAMLSDRKSTRLNSSHTDISRMPSSA